MKEILNKLIPYYEKAIMLIKDEAKKLHWLDIVEYMNVNRGICYCACSKFNTDIYSEKWVKEHTPENSSWWFYQVCKAKDEIEAIHLLQLRVDKMKQILQESNI